ncbi:UNVERIFIED_CONTAM: hypothetical protein Sradi_4356900 [Sesamum radiatum]|uniref:Zinc knuckle CX2CX4HX4C domain-containing protein n=1 Tax=Sesamum radiatum TaxID=300843 RepID=A0AAW2NPL7_SESRA
MDAEIKRMGRVLQLTEEDDIGHLMPDGLLNAELEGYQLCLVGRLLANRIANFEGFSQFVKSMINPVKVDLDWCDFFVHIHDLPLSKMNVGVATFIGNSIGRFRDMEMDERGCAWGASLRIKVGLNVNLPLKRALKIKTPLGGEHLVSFTYERLPNFCYLCGRLGHIGKYGEVSFTEGFVDPGEDPHMDLGFGPP